MQKCAGFFFVRRFSTELTSKVQYGSYMDASLLPRFFCVIRQDKVTFLYPACFAVDRSLPGPDVIR
jgi:hypothetical protein